MILNRPAGYFNNGSSSPTPFPNQGGGSTTSTSLGTSRNETIVKVGNKSVVTQALTSRAGTVLKPSGMK